MTPDDVRLFIQAGEDRGLEFKASFPWIRNQAGETMARVAKTILAMSNLRDGGRIIIGVAEPDSGSTEWQAIGINPASLKSFSFDEVADFVRKYAEPYARFALEIIEVDSVNLIVITVEGFREVPVICKASYGNILADGAIYIRPQSGRPRSEILSNYADMRELLDIAIERGVRKFWHLQSIAQQAQQADEQQFNDELKRFQ